MRLPDAHGKDGSGLDKRDLKTARQLSISGLKARTFYVLLSATLLSMVFNINNWLKALLFSTSDPLDIKQIQWVYHRVREQTVQNTDNQGENEESPTGESVPMAPQDSPLGTSGPDLEGFPVLLTSSAIRDALDALEKEFENRNEVYRLVKTPQGYRLCVAPEYGEWVRALRGETKPLKLSQAALETLAIIAYRQPVTRAEIERIRGVSVDSALSRLVELELAISTGRAELPGRPLQYATTDRFLEFCGLESISDLPTSDILSNQRIDEWVDRQDGGESSPEQETLGLQFQ
jgi:segregation and condensation protein B